LSAFAGGDTAQVRGGQGSALEVGREAASDDKPLRTAIVAFERSQKTSGKRAMAKARITLAVAVIGAAAFVACPALLQAQEKVTIRYGEIANSARSISAVPLQTALQRGFLAREGIELKRVPLGGTTYMIEELDKGNIDVSHTASPYMIQAALKGSDAVAIFGGPANAVYTLIAKPGIKTFADLKGKVVGVSLPADTISLSTRMLLAAHGLKDGDYIAKELVSSKARGECLESAACDAVPLGQPDDIVFKSKGFTRLGDSLEVLPVLQFTVIAAERAWAEQHKDAVTRLVRAFGATYRFLRDPANREEVTQIIVSVTGATPETAREVLKLYYEPDRGVMPKQAEISMPGLTKVIEVLQQSGEITGPLPPADRFVDLQYLKAAGLQ
jgi:ABC-type nitrate/sulfonate/bicarbonate transport system substrate-binding protein